MKEENDLDVIFGGGSVGDFDELSMLSPPSSQDNQRLQEHGRITTFKLSNQVTKKAVTFTLETLTIKSKRYGKTTLKGKLVDWVEPGLFWSNRCKWNGGIGSWVAWRWCWPS